MEDERSARLHERGARAHIRHKAMFSIDHIGVAVKSLTAAKAIYEKLGLKLAPEETVEAEQVRVVMVPLGESRIELLEPTSENSVIAKFIAKRGEGIAPRLTARARPGGRGRAAEKRRRAPGVRRNQDRGRRSPLRFCASLKRGRGAARTGGIGKLSPNVWRGRPRPRKPAARSKSAGEGARATQFENASSRCRHFG